jgi:hypothetical protein
MDVLLDGAFTSCIEFIAWSLCAELSTTLSHFIIVCGIESRLS